VKNITILLVVNEGVTSVTLSVPVTIWRRELRTLQVTLVSKEGSKEKNKNQGNDVNMFSRYQLP